MFRLETTRTTGKDNFIKERGLTRPRFFYVVIIRRSTRASSPVRQRKVVLKKLFPFNRSLNKESCFRCMKIRRFGGKEKIQKNRSPDKVNATAGRLNAT